MELAQTILFISPASEAVGAQLGRMEQRGEVLSAAELGASGEMN